MANELAFAEDEKVLPGKGFVGFDPVERMDGHFLFDLGFAHFMHGFDGNLRIFGAEFEEDQATAGFEGLAEGIDHFVGKIEFVIDIHEQRQIERGGRKFRVGDGAENWFNVVNFEGSHFVGEQVEHFLLDFDGIDDAFFANGSGEAAGVIAGACADVGCGFAGLEFQGGDGEVGSLFVLTFWAFDRQEGEKSETDERAETGGLHEKEYI